MRFKEFSKKLRENLEPHTKKPALPSKKEKEETVRQLNIARKNNNQAEIKRLTDKLLKLDGGSFPVNLDGDAISENAAEPDEPKSDQPKKHSKHISSLPSAASLDDEPEDSEEDDEDEDTEDNEKAAEKFKEFAGNFGNDLYVLSTIDFLKNDFTSAAPEGRVINTILYTGVPVIEEFLDQNLDDILNNHTVSALFLNDKNKEFFAFYADADGARFSPKKSTQQLVADDIIDQSQATALAKAVNRGENYAQALGKIDWRGGETAPSDLIYNKLTSLVDALKLPDMPAPVQREPYNPSPEVKKFSRLSKDRLKAKYGIK